jgi:hypothetical protein
VQRPNLREFLHSVLEDVEDLPAGFAERLEDLVDAPPDERAEKIQSLIEETAR